MVKKFLAAVFCTSILLSVSVSAVDSETVKTSASEKYSTWAYNIDVSNYFKLRDITDSLDCRVEWDDKNQLIKVYTSLPASDDPSEPVG